MIRHEEELGLGGRSGLLVALVPGEEALGRARAADDFPHLALHLPVEDDVEPVVEHPGEIALRQHDETGLEGLQLADGLLPEVVAHAMRIVAAVTVDAHFLHPVFQGVFHRSPQFLLAKVQLGHVLPFSILGRPGDAAVGLVLIPLGMLGKPHVVPGGVVGHPVEHHFHSLGLGGVHQGFQFIQRAVQAVHLLVIPDAVGRPERFVSGQPRQDVLSFGIHRHQVQDVRTQGLDLVQPRLHLAEGAGVAVQFQVHLVDLVMVTGRRRQREHFRGIGNAGFRDGLLPAGTGLLAGGDDGQRLRLPAATGGENEQGRCQEYCLSHFVTGFLASRGPVRGPGP